EQIAAGPAADPRGGAQEQGRPRRAPGCRDRIPGTALPGKQGHHAHEGAEGSGRAGRQVKVRDVIRKIEEDGWRIDSQKGSHRQYVHPTKPGRVTVAGKPNDDMHPKTLGSVLTQAQLKKT